MAGDDRSTFPPEDLSGPGAQPPGSDDSPIPDDPSYRYVDLGQIGKGAMGEVRRVLDRDLNRVVAMKIVRRSLMQERRVVDRFVAEAQATAQLEHPSIVPVHEFGVLPDGRFFFTMKEVRGTTLRRVINELHRPGVGASLPDSWTLTRVIDVLRRVCDAVAYAHARGVVHRDLKPDNVMVGDYGEVLVLDWGLSKVAGESAAGKKPVVTNRSQSKALQTLPGTLAGTPSYMPPEQAKGDFHDLGPPADVYSVGAMLYEVLLGRPAYKAKDPQAAIAKVLAGPPDRPLPSSFAWGQMSRLQLAGSRGPAVPRELVRICRRAMARDPEQRYPDAQPLAHDISAWLDGSKRRDQAREHVADAERLFPEVARGRARSAELAEEAKRILASIPPHASVEEKRVAWEVQDRADLLERRAAINETRALQLLQGALALVPDLDDAHDALADYYRKRHEQAERHGVSSLASRYEALLHIHDTGRHTEYLDGTARLVLMTEEPGAYVEFARYEDHLRVQTAGEWLPLGETPLVSVPVPHGSAVLRIRGVAADHVTYPVHVGRLEHWDGVPPEGFAPHPVHLPTMGTVGPDASYVPAGWFKAGGANDTPGALRPARLWVDGFVIRRDPVTVEEYIEFLDDLDERGLFGVATKCIPRAQQADGSLEDPLLAVVDGKYTLAGSWKGWGLKWPVTCIDWFGAVTYADWYAERAGLPWRLPTELEWEKAARGVDGRVFPWGDHFDPAFCNMQESHDGGGRPVSVGEFPVDTSPYGVRGMAGNVKELCLDAFDPAQPAVDAHGRALVVQPPDTDMTPRVDRGGAWVSLGRSCRLASRRPVHPQRRSPARGFRLARSVPWEPPR